MTPDTRNAQALPLVGKAPSSHNTQPWIFGIGASKIDLFAEDHAVRD